MPVNKKRKISHKNSPPDVPVSTPVGTTPSLQSSPQPVQAPIAEQPEIVAALQALIREMQTRNQMAKLQQKRNQEQKKKEDMLAEKAKDDDAERFRTLGSNMYS